MIQSPVGHESSEIRVILVGQTGLDAALRRDPAIELIRSRTPLDAIGELADPIVDTSPTVRGRSSAAPRGSGASTSWCPSTASRCT